MLQVVVFLFHWHMITKSQFLCHKRELETNFEQKSIFRDSSKKKKTFKLKKHFASMPANLVTNVIELMFSS